MAMTARGASKFPLKSPQADDAPELQGYLKDTRSEVRQLLDAGKRIVIEGTQGPKATSRDTTAAAFLAEAGLTRFLGQGRCIGAPILRKSCWLNGLSQGVGESRCRQSVARCYSNLHGLKGARW